MLHKLLRMLRRAFRHRQSDIVRVLCPDCLDMVNPYQEHLCWGHLKTALALSFEHVEQNAGPANEEYCYSLEDGHTRGWTCQHSECKETE
jgi:hypothetical protein